MRVRSEPALPRGENHPESKARMIMKLIGRMTAGTVAFAALIGTASLAQEVEPPFTWKGKGEVSFISERGVRNVSFDFELSIDGSGGINGKTSNDEGESLIKHVFYGERVEHEIPGYHSRKTILVLVINERGNRPMLAVLNGRLLGDRLFTGEALIKRYEPDSQTDKALGVGDPMATQIDADDLPSDLKSALKKTVPVGMVKIEGAYQN